MIGWMGLGATSLGGAAAGSPSAHLASASGSAPAVTAASASTGAATTAESNAAAVAVGSSNTAAAMAEHALAATQAAGLKSNVVFVPRPSASAAQIAQSEATGEVTPLYSGVPAPIGVAYYGLSGNGHSAPVGTILNTTAVRGIVDANATGIQGSDLYQSSPDSYGIQLNSVMTNVTLFGQGGYSFWTQNVVEFYPSAGFMILVTNIWNFSGGSYVGDEFYSHSLNAPGAVDDFSDYAELGYYYAEALIYTPISYPFDLVLTMNSGTNGGRDNISFSVSLTSPTIPAEDFSLPNWDVITFNSTATGQTPDLTVPSNYTANGLQYNPVGLTDDFELDVCGPGGGSQVDLSAADATLGLAYLSSGSWTSVPAAYNYGGETGETAVGANVAYNDTGTGPGGLSTYGTMSAGPTVLSGLWGTGAPAGSSVVTVDVTPANAFDLFQYNGSDHTYTKGFVSELSLAPSMGTNTFYLMNGSWELLIQLADYQQVVQTIAVAGPATISVTLASDPSAGVYTPLWAFNNAEIAAISSGGAGTPSSPYLVFNNQLSPLSSHYGLYNDYGFPVYPGVFFADTTASVELYQMPSFWTYTNDFQSPGRYLPAWNDLQYWFWNDSNVALVDSTSIGGWFSSYAFYPTAFDSFNVIFYEGGHNLVAGNTFATPSAGLLLYSGGTIFGPLNIGGGNNTVWGNTFEQVANPTNCPDGCVLGELNPAFGLGLEIAESNDLVYNNAVLTPTTAWLLPINLYSGDPEFFTGDSWNVTPQPASDVNTLANFPTLPLSGSIVGGATQGGNYWWDYGIEFNPYNGADNPLGVLPYDENAETLLVEIYGPSYYFATYIYGTGWDAGDFAPLTLSGVGPTVTFTEHGLAPGTSWGAYVTVDGIPYGFVTTAASEALSIFPAGTYHWYANAPAPTGYTAPRGGTLHLTHAVSVTVAYHLASGYSFLTFHESGLPHGTAWSVTVGANSQTTTATSVEFLAQDGTTYSYTVHGIASGYSPSPASGSVLVSRATSVHIHFAPTTYGLVFSETGLTAGANWGVRVTGPFNGHSTSSKTVRGTSASLTVPTPNGTFTYTVLAPAHSTCTPASGSESISGAGVTVDLSCTVSGGGLPAGGALPTPALPSMARLAVVRAPSA